MDTIKKRKLSYEQYKKGIDQQLQSSAAGLKNTIFYCECLKKPIIKNTVFYEADSGSGLKGKPKSMFLNAVSDSSLTHIWSIKSPDLLEEDLTYYEQTCNIRFVERYSSEYYESLAVSQYLVTDGYFTSTFVKREEQTLICTGNDSAFTFSGYDKGIINVDTEQFVERHYLQADYILSSNEQYQKTVLESAYKLKNMYDGKIIQGVLPFHPSHSLPSASRYSTNSKSTVLLLPALQCKTAEEISASASFYADIIEQLDFEDIYISVPLAAYDIFQLNDVISQYLLPPHIDCRDLKYRCVITDGNVLYEDFVQMKTPVYILKNKLLNEQLYTDLLTFCNLNPQSPKKIKEMVQNSEVSFPYIHTLDNSIWSTVKENTSSPFVTSFHSTKKRIAFFIDFLQNLDQHAYLHLLHTLDWIDYNQIDVTLIASSFKKNDKEVISEINKNVRYLDCSGRLPYDKEAYAAHRYLSKYLYNMDNSTDIVNQDIFELYRRNSQRICNNISFDTTILFGYFTQKDYLLFEGFSSKKRLYLGYQNLAKEKAIWVQNKITAFTFTNKIRIYSSFDERLYFSVGLHRSNTEEYTDLASNCSAVPILPSKKQLEDTTDNIRTAVYDNREYFMIPCGNKPFKTKEVLLLPKVDKSKLSYLYVINNDESRELLSFLETFLNGCTQNDCQMFLVDNYNYLDDSILTFIAKHSLSEKIVILKNIFLNKSYASQFDGIVSLHPQDPLDYNVLLSQFFRIDTIIVEDDEFQLKKQPMKDLSALSEVITKEISRLLL